MKPYFHFLISLISPHLSYHALSCSIICPIPSYLSCQSHRRPKKSKAAIPRNREESQPSHISGEKLFLIFVVSNF